MSLFYRTQQLLKVTAGCTTPQSSKAHAVLPSADGLQLRAFIDLTQTGGGTGAKTTIHLETSHDGNWIEAVYPLTLNGEGSLHRFVELLTLGPLVRARVDVSGSPPCSYSALVKLAGTSAFALREKATSFDTIGDSASEGGSASQAATLTNSSTAPQSGATVETAQARKPQSPDL